MIRYLLNIFSYVLPPSRFFLFRKLFLIIARVKVGKKTIVCGHGRIYGPGALSIGNNTWLSPGIFFYTHKDAPIRIGSNCDIGPRVEFITGSHDIGSDSRRAGFGWARPILVNDGCWIGAGVKILGGVTVGNGSVIAAGAIVIRDVPANVLVAGIPATIKKNLM